MRVYRSDEEDKLYLSPYCRLSSNKEITVFYQPLFDRTIPLRIKPDISKDLVHTLSRGCFMDDIEKVLEPILKKEEIKSLVDEFIRAGIIE